MDSPSGAGVSPSAPTVPGRGAAANPHNRFERLRAVEDAEYAEHERALAGDPSEAPPPRRGPPTQYFNDPSRSLLSKNESPDVPFDVSINPYRGCEHGCIYCYARPNHEYLGLSAGLDFESKIFVKQRAPELLRAALASKSWKPRLLAIGGVTDAYQPVERRLRITRRCLEFLAEFRNPTALVTAAAEAGASSAGHTLLRLPHALSDLFEDWLKRHFPDRVQKVLNRVRSTRGGNISDPRFHSRMKGSGFYADQIHQVFALACRRAGIDGDHPQLSTAAFRRPSGPQLSLFEQEPEVRTFSSFGDVT